jgi:hypothetical protein
MAEQKNSSRKRRNARGHAASGVGGTILPPDLAIPCWVAPLQSPTPFRQAKQSVARKWNLGADLLPSSGTQNRHKRPPGQMLENRHKRLPGRRRETDAILARQIRILGIIVIHIGPQSTQCRFSRRRANVEVQALRDRLLDLRESGFPRRSSRSKAMPCQQCHQFAELFFLHCRQL